MVSVTPCGPALRVPLRAPSNKQHEDRGKAMEMVDEERKHRREDETGGQQDEYKGRGCGKGEGQRRRRGHREEWRKSEEDAEEGTGVKWQKEI